MKRRAPLPSRVDELRSAIGAHRVRALPGRRHLRAAAVAVVVEATGGPARVLLIRRPRRAGDRWSGDVAFPGGLARTGESLGETAAREAAEEVGLVLGAPTGRLRDRLTVEPGRMRPMLVRPLVYVHPHTASIVVDPREVADAFLVGVEEIRTSDVRLGLLGRRRMLAPYRPVGEHRLWGLSLSIMEELLEVLRANPR